MKGIRIVVITGPTASGKTRLALTLAEDLNAEIVNADSMQVYRYMDIGTAKPSMEERNGIPYHLLDVVSPDENYTVANYRSDASRTIEDIHSRGKNIIVVGGSGLYIRVLERGIFSGPSADDSFREYLKGLELRMGSGYIYNMLKEIDPLSAERIHPNNSVRVIRALEVYHLTNKTMSEFQEEHGFRDNQYIALKIALSKDREMLYRDIEKRVDQMIDCGLEEETRNLLERGYPSYLKPMQSIGYREMIDYIDGRCPLSEAVSRIKKNTRNYAKRQITWLRGECDIKWLSHDDTVKVKEIVDGFLK